MQATGYGGRVQFVVSVSIDTRRFRLTRHHLTERFNAKNGNMSFKKLCLLNKSCMLSWDRDCKSFFLPQREFLTNVFNVNTTILNGAVLVI